MKNDFGKYFDARNTSRMHLEKIAQKKGGPGYPVENSAQTASNNSNDLEVFKPPRSDAQIFFAKYMDDSDFAKGVDGWTDAFLNGNSRASDDWVNPYGDPTMVEEEEVV